MGKYLERIIELSEMSENLTSLIYAQEEKPEMYESKDTQNFQKVGCDDGKKPEMYGLANTQNFQNPVSPFRRANEFVFLPAQPKSEAERQARFEIALATEIMQGAYFNQADNVWCIGWATKGKHAWQRACLDWGGTLSENGVPSIAAAEVIEWAKERLETPDNEPAPGGDDDTRRAAVLRGETVVANKNSDGALIEWAESQGLAVGIMRQNQWKNAKWASEWENPKRMKKALEGRDRDDVCDRHAALLAESPEMRARIGELKGRVLVCCCYPLRCHGDELARRANDATNDENSEKRETK